MNTTKACFFVLAFIFHGVAVHSQQVTWGAIVDNGLGLANGTDLPQGNLVRVGFFNTDGDANTIDDDTIRSNQGNFAFLDSHFTQYGTAAVGDSLGVDGHWTKTSTGATEPSLVGNQIYIWAFNNSVASSATQQGILYLSKSVDSDWQFPVQTPIPGTSAIDLTDLTDGPGTSLIPVVAVVVLGGFGTGTSDQAPNAPLFNLVAVPEPSAYATAFGLLCLGGAFVRRGFRIRQNR